MIIVLDFMTNEVHSYNVDANFDWYTTEDFIVEQGHNINNCEYMTSPAGIPIQFYTH